MPTTAARRRDCSERRATQRDGVGRGFIAALDQSGGSTPKALKLYGIPEDAYGNDEQMFDLIHQMRERLMSSPSFTGDKILATILFEQTMDRTINGEDTRPFYGSRNTSCRS